MELEEAIKIIKSIIYNEQGELMDYIDISFSPSKDDIDAEEFMEAIETVLQALENTQKENSNLKSYLSKQGLISDYIKLAKRENK